MFSFCKGCNFFRDWRSVYWYFSPKIFWSISISKFPGKFSMGPEPLSSSSTSSNLHDYLFTSVETAFVMKLILSNWTGFLALCICIHYPGCLTYIIWNPIIKLPQLFAYLVIYNAILFLYKYCFQMWFLRHWIVCFVFRIKYLDIFKVVELTCDQHQKELVTSPSLEEIIHYDLWARKYAASLQESSHASPVLAWVKLALVGLYKVGPTWNGDVAKN